MANASWRQSYDYRGEYFRRNPGLLGCIWICSQCGKPLLGKNSVQVDHIIPPSMFSIKKYQRGKLISNTSVLARALNSGFNTVAICPRCNVAKSDKTGVMTARGMAAKTAEVAAGTTQKAVGLALFGVGRAVWGATRLLTLPFRKRTSVTVKAFFLGLYLVIAFVAVQKCGG